jgi:predicted deacylase
MRHLKMLTGEVQRNDAWIIAREDIVQENMGGFWLPDVGFEFRKRVRADTVLARVVDIYGEPREEIRSPCDGETIGMRTNRASTCQETTARTLPKSWTR